MSEIQKMRQYIERTKAPYNIRYALDLSQSFALIDMSQETAIEAFTLAFQYGLAKGYRMAKAEAKKKVRKEAHHWAKIPTPQNGDHTQGMEVASL